MKTSAHMKLHRRYTPYVFAFYMAGIVAFLVSCINVALHSGAGTSYWTTVLQAYLSTMPIVFVCIILVRPLAVRLVSFTVDA